MSKKKRNARAKKRQELSHIRQEVGKKRGDRGAKILSNPSAILAVIVIVVVLVGAAIVMGRERAGGDKPSSTAQVTGWLPPPTVFTSGASMGSPEAPITVTEYADFQCKFCQQFASGLEEEIGKAYIETGKVRFEYKHRIIGGEESMLMAIASEAAEQQGKFWLFHKVLMQYGAKEEPGDVSLAILENLARQSGLDMIAFRASMNSTKLREKVVQEDAAALLAGAQGTPTFFVNGVKAEGESQFKPLFEATLNKLNN